MTPLELKKIRQRHKITLLEVAATAGIPSEHIRKIEDGEYPALDSDLTRIENALKTLARKQKDDEAGDEEPGFGLRKDGL